MWYAQEYIRQLSDARIYTRIPYENINIINVEGHQLL